MLDLNGEGFCKSPKLCCVICFNCSGIEEEEKPDEDASDNDEIYPDDWSFILDGYSKLYKHLNPDTCEVDRIVKFILDANIPVRGVNILNLKKTALEHPGYVKAK